MKKLLSAFVLLLFYFSSNAQQKNYQAVFDVSIKDSISQQAAIRALGQIKDASPDADLEVVVYGQGLNLVLKNKSPNAAEVMRLINSKHVAFKVCGMTLSRNHVDKSELIPGVEVVPDGIYEIVTKEKAGWGYIKAAQ